MKSQDRWGCSPQDIERKIEEGKAEAEALEAQHLEVQRECEAVEQQCKEHKQAMEQDQADIVKLNQQRCQVRDLGLLRKASSHGAYPLDDVVMPLKRYHDRPLGKAALQCRQRHVSWFVTLQCVCAGAYTDSESSRECQVVQGSSSGQVEDL